MIYITADKTIDFESLGYTLKTNPFPDIAAVRNSQQSVIGRDGNFIFSDGFNNNVISVKLTAADSLDIRSRRINAREIKQELIKPGKLVLDYEPDVYYNARVLNGSRISFGSAFDEVFINFTVDPIALSNVDESNLTWDEADQFWKTLDLPWLGYEESFSVVPSEVISIFNRGDIESKPIIQLDGIGDVTFTHTNGETFTYSGLNGIINIDTRNMVVYDDSKVNAIVGFSGDFMNLDIGNNDITVTGTFATLIINFENKDFFI